MVIHLVVPSIYLIHNEIFIGFAAPQVISMLGNSYSTSGGPLSQSQIQAGNNQLSSMGMLNDVNSNDNSPFDMNDFPQLTGRPSSAGGPQGQLGSRLTFCIIHAFPQRWFSCRLQLIH